MTAELAHQFETGLATNVGCRRQVNEDAMLARPELGLWVVADGMGGHAAGDFASDAVVKELGSLGCAASEQDLAARFMDRLARANDQIRARATELGGTVIGTTVVSFLVYRSAYACIWSGDSRAYLLRNGQLVQQSRDHTEINALLAAGMITEAEAINWPRKNVVTRAIGVTPEPQCDQVSGQLEQGDVFLLCSDGLNEHLQDGEIAQILMDLPPQQACDALIRKTLDRGARDNVTVIVVQCQGFSDDAVWAAEDILDDLA